MPRYRIFHLLAALPVLAAGPAPCRAGTMYLQTNLVSDISGLAAHTDSALKNPWGISFAPDGPFWVSDERTGLVTLYDGGGNKRGLSVVVPGGKPTGQVFNSTGDFALSGGNPSAFLFATLNGTIAAWGPSLGFGANTQGQQVVPTSGASYTGLALGTSAIGSTLYAADNKGGKIDTFNGSFASTPLSGNFADPNRPSGVTPYNIQNINGSLYVTWEGPHGTGASSTNSIRMGR
jgi:uncharacterized protein (TIGR03118 family)